MSSPSIEHGPQQQALFPEPERRPEPSTPSLDALIQRARVEAATKADGGAVGTVVARLAANDGHAPVATLRAEGFPDDAIAAALTTDPEDRRRKPRARLGVVDGTPLLWLTTTGWQSAGRTSRRERSPSAESAIHAAAPTELSGWLAQQLAPWPGLRVSVSTGEPCRAWSERVKALAWSRVQGAGDANGAYGVLTGGLLPDALLVERWHSAADYRSAWGHDPATAEDAAEQTCALEVELARKGEPLRWKVERWQAALDLGAAHAVVWVVRSRTIADDLRALGVGADGSRQLLVPGAEVGLGGDAMPDLPTTWWPLRIGEGQR